MNPLRTLQLLLLAAVVAAGVTGVISYRRLAEKAATAEHRIEQAEATSSELQRQFDTLSEESIRRDEFDRALREARSAISRNLDTATREDPASADYLSEPVPQRVRDAYLQGSQTER